MKRIITIPLAAMLVLTFSACKKNWVCTCTTKAGDTYIGGTPKDVSKKDAKSACNAIGAVYGDICTASKN